MDGLGLGLGLTRQGSGEPAPVVTLSNLNVTAAPASFSVDADGAGSTQWLIDQNPTRTAEQIRGQGAPNSVYGASAVVAGTNVITGYDYSDLADGTNYVHIVPAGAGDESVLNSIGFEYSSTYTANAVDNNDAVYGYASSYTGGPAAGKTGTISFWVYFDYTPIDTTAEVFFEAMDAGGGTRWFIRKQSSQQILWQLRNSSNTNILVFTSVNGVFSAQTWHHVLLSWDLAATTRHVYIDGSAVTQASGSITNDTVPAIVEISVAARTTGADVGNFNLSDFFADEVYRDITQAANRGLFRDEVTGKPVNLSGLGTPHLLLTGDETNFFTNNGTGSNLTETGGSLTAAATSPSD